VTGESVVRLRAASSTDEYGDETPGTEASKTFTGVAVAPRYSTEGNDNRSAVVVGLTLYFPAGSDVLSTDRWRVRGAVYETVGDAATWVNPFTSVNHGLEVAVKRVTG
jgi:hypothetical protein